MTNGNEELRQISGSDFTSLGLQQIAYVRPVSVDAEGAKGFAVHAADGTRLAVMDALDLAHAAILENDMHLVNVH